MVCGDNARVDVGARSKIVKNTSSDSSLDKVQRIFSLDDDLRVKYSKQGFQRAYLHVGLPATFKYCHSGQTP